MTNGKENNILKNNLIVPKGNTSNTKWYSRTNRTEILFQIECNLSLNFRKVVEQIYNDI